MSERGKDSQYEIASEGLGKSSGAQVDLDLHEGNMVYYIIN